MQRGWIRVFRAGRYRLPSPAVKCRCLGVRPYPFCGGVLCFALVFLVLFLRVCCVVLLLFLCVFIHCFYRFCCCFLCFVFVVCGWFIVCVLCLRAICRLVVVGRRGSPLACRLLRGDGAVAVWWPRPSCMSHTVGVVRGVCRSRRRELFVIVLCFAVSFAFAAALVRRSMVFRRRLFGRGL